MPSGTELSARVAAIPAPVQGALYMTFAALCFSVMNVLVRLAADELDPMQVAFFRNFFAVAFMLPWLARVGMAGLHTERFKLHVVRGIFGLMTMSGLRYCRTICRRSR